MPKKPKLKKPNLKKPTFKKPSKQGFKSAAKSVKLWTFVLLVAGLGMFGYASYTWYDNVFTDEDRIFYDMISNSLSTQGVTREITQTQGTRTENQTFLLTFTPVPAIQSLSKVEEISQSREKSTVTTETIGVKDSDFVRYTDINIPPTPGSSQDYSKLLNTWANRNTSAEGASAQFLNDAIFTFIPFGNFPPELNDELVQMIKDKEVYRPEKAQIEYRNGRPYYTNTIGIKPRGLVEVLQRYNELTGIGDANLLNPEQYDDYHSLGVKIEIDMISRQLKEVSYPGDSRVEKYAAYGLTSSIEVPQGTISIEELQSRVQ